MLPKQINSHGQKAFQRTGDTEDRSLPYKNWLRTINKPNGFFMDIDMIKFKWINGVPTPVAITDLTRTDSMEVSESYLKAIENRIFNRDSQGMILKTLGTLLNIPVYLVLFPSIMDWVYVYSFRGKRWKKFTAIEWSDYLKKL